MNNSPRHNIIPLPDAEVVTCYTSARVLSPFHRLSMYPNSVRTRAMRWAIEAYEAGRDLLMIIWPDLCFCFVVVPRNSEGIPAMLERSAILAAYRHAQNDPDAHQLFSLINAPLNQGVH